MERAHRELRAGFADGLGGDDADRFTELDQRSGREVATVAMAANAVLAFASEHRANANAIQASNVNALGLDLVNFFVRFDEEFLRAGRIDDVVAGKTANQTVGDFDHFVFAFKHGGNPDAVRGAAIRLLDDDVLGHIDQFAGHVTGVSRLEGGIGQTFTSAVG